MLEILGVLIAFVSVILLLSLLVTTAAHFTQSVLRLRGRSLERGIAELLPAVTSLDPKDARRVARRICEAPLVDPGRNVVVPESGWLRDGLIGRLFSWIRGTARSSMTAEELAEAVATVGHAHPKSPPETKATAPAAEQKAEDEKARELVKERVRELCPRMARVSKRRFAFRMRIACVFWGALVAVAYQVNTPELLARLSRDLGARATAPETARAGLSGAAGQTLMAAVAMERPGDQEDRYPGRLTPWPGGSAYYVTNGSVNWRVLPGLLMTTILLTLGAPFWYQQLKNLSGLRDVLAPPKDQEKDTGKDRP